jgi:hypothetical protein
VIPGGPVPGDTRQVRTWQDAELNAAAWMRHWGFADARAGLPGPDGGIDIRSSRGLAQVKFKAQQVGRPDVQRLVGAAGRDQAQLLFFTGTSYSKNAMAYAEEMGIALFVYSLDGAVTAVNRHASMLATSPPPRPSRPGTVHSAWGLRRNWRAAFGYLFTWGLVAGLVNPENYKGSVGYVLLLIPTTATLLCAVAFLFLRAHWRANDGKWPPNRARSAKRRHPHR